MPPAPSKPGVSAGNAQVTLTWTSNGNGGSAITGWQYQYKTTGDYGSWTDISDSGPNTTSYTVTGLTNGTDHRFKVRAVNGIGDGTASPESNAIKPGIVCGRTAQVRDAIVNKVSGKTTCGEITTADLAAITGYLVVINNSSLTALKDGDFDGLTQLEMLFLQNNSLNSLPKGIFDDLTKLTRLNLEGNSLSSLPAGLFKALAKLDNLNLRNNSLSSLPSGLFNTLTSLTLLDVGNNNLSSLPAGIFNNLTKLGSLYLDYSSLSSLPAGLFDNLTALTTLWLDYNSLTCLPAIPASVTGAELKLDNARSSYAACGAGVTVSKTDLKLVPGRAATYTVVLDAAPNGSAGNVTVTPVRSATGPATISPGSLTFTTTTWSTAQSITVTSVANGKTTVSHTVTGGGYDSVTAASVDVQVSAVTLTASAVEAATATLTIDGHTDVWYYKYTSPTGGSCSAAVVAGTSTANLTQLSANMSYTYKAYSDSSCTTELASETLLTKPGKPAKPTASAGTGSGKLRLVSSVTGSGTLIRWKYKKKEGNNAFENNWTDIPSSTSTSLDYVVSGLTDGTSYQFKVLAENGSGDGAESDASDAVELSITPKANPPTLNHGDKKIFMSWSNPVGITLQANRIRYRKKGTEPWTYADASSDSDNQNFEGQVSSAMIPANETFTMEEGTTYEVQLRHGKWNGGYVGWGEWSDVAEATTITTGETPKANPPALNHGGQQISVFWSNPVGVSLEANRIRYRAKGTSAWTYADANASLSGDQNFEGQVSSAMIPANETFTMEEGTTYQVQLRHGKWNDDYSGWGAWSDVAEATTITTGETPKANPPTLNNGDQQISVSWSNPVGISLEANRIRYRAKGTSTWTYADASPNSDNQNFEGQVSSAMIPANETFTMEEGTTYEVQLRHGKWNDG